MISDDVDDYNIYNAVSEGNENCDTVIEKSNCLVRVCLIH